jgi:aquaporin Z
VDPSSESGYCLQPPSKIAGNAAIRLSNARRWPAPLRRRDGLSALASLRLHWPEYAMEVAGLGLYLFATCVAATVLQHPASPVRQMFPDTLTRRAFMGLSMGATITAIVLSPWGKQSGGHFNPAVTIAFYRLGKVEFWDTWFYVAAQFLGAIGGVCVARYALRGALGNNAVHYATTIPGLYGRGVAFAAEIAISLILMTTILFASNRASIAPYTAYLAGTLTAIYLTFEAPLSGMSTNPARTFAPALHAGHWYALWIYFFAPTIGMLIASEIFLYARGGLAPECAKLHHANNKRCIFHHHVTFHQSSDKGSEPVARKGEVA